MGIDEKMLPPDQAALLDAGRKDAHQHMANKTAAKVAEVTAAAGLGPIAGPGVQYIAQPVAPAAPAAAAPIVSGNGTKVVTLLDGRDVTVSDQWVPIVLKNLQKVAYKMLFISPPRTPFQMVVGKIFKGVEFEESDAQLAMFMTYIRQIDDRPMPEPIVNKTQVDQIAYELGDLGCRAVRECFAENWPGGGGIFWDEVKK